MADLGRNVYYGIGKGADVSATYWINQLSFDLASKNTTAVNTSAWGNLVKSNASTVVRKWAEGSLETKLTSDSSGLLLLGAFGSVATADNADSDASVKDHTFTLSNSISGQPLTLIRKDSLDTEKFTSARISNWELSMALDDYIKYSADIISKDGATTTATPAFVDETEFVAKHFTVKTATTVGGLGAATAESTCESLTLTVNPNIEADNGAGSDAPYSFTSRGYDLSFEMTCRYNSTVYRDAFRNGTNLALQISVVNTDVTIGTAANPGLVFTAPKVNITDWSPSEDVDSPISQSMTGTIHFSAADAYALRAVMTNTTSNY